MIQGTTCKAVLCTLVSARDQMLSQIGRENLVKLVVYASDQTHSAFQKAAQIAGIHPMNYKAIKTSKSTSFELSPDSLRAQICEDVEAGLVPLFLCATVGTTSTAAVDPLGSICAVVRDYGIWVHVDAAYPRSACICPGLIMLLFLNSKLHWSYFNKWWRGLILPMGRTKFQILTPIYCTKKNILLAACKEDSA